ncbi:MAG TPA: hypothetical protein VM366_20575 [Anaerolineae bacterium]|nr:hypothetical protein [Anaerolineae bacterium]
MRYWYGIREWLGRLGSSGMRDHVPVRGTVRRGRKRLLALLFLFDALLIVATLLSFQNAELVEEEQMLEETRDVYETVYREQVITVTTVITEVVPYGSIP